VALSFAFAGPVAEVVNSCVFVFAKHAYDVGDYCLIKDKKLVVKRIYLTHTNFEEVNGPDERGRVVQISHSALTAELIVNWTRSNDVQEEAAAEQNKKQI
jgi:small-conductance mechanosensitive channel